MRIHCKCWGFDVFKNNTWFLEVDEQSSVVELVDDLPWLIMMKACLQEIGRAHV